jgi:putative phage-type endonuclease
MALTQQGTPAWFAARQGKLTASRFGAAAGICPFSSRAKALRLAVGAEKWSGGIEACLWGTRNEKNAIKDYMVRTGNVVRSMGFKVHPHHDWLGGSPDGLVGDEGIIEVKCPFYKQVPHAQIPPHYYCQVNGLLEILDRQWCDYISWTPTEMKVYRVWRQPDLFDFLLDRYTVFFAYMKRGCAKMPRVRSEEKRLVLQRIAEADEGTAYAFWERTEPGYLQNRWEAPPSDPYESETDEEPSSKRSCANASPLRELPLVPTAAA